MSWTQIQSVVTDLLTAFIVAALGVILNGGEGILETPAKTWIAAADAGLAAIAYVVYRWLDKSNTTYGRGAVTFK